MGEGGGGCSKRISLNRNPNVNKKNVWGGEECRGGAGEMGLEKVFLYESNL